MKLTLNKTLPMGKQKFEIVERKGLGHPDTLADGVAESISLDYSKYCLKNFGAILHHNVDKISILGGLCRIDFGSGIQVKPVNLILNGRMSSSFAGQEIDVESIQKVAAVRYLGERLPRFHIKQMLNIHSFVSSSSRNPYFFKPRSIEDLPEHASPYANDTSTAMGFWPLSQIERLVLSVERSIYVGEGHNLRPKFEFIGQDVKVMAMRTGNTARFVICAPFFADDMRTSVVYEEKKAELYRYLLSQLRKNANGYKIDLDLNTEDQRVKDPKEARGRYFCVTGSALDYGEEGMVGRGNRVFGVISCMRPSTVEAACGKNPVYHAGKVYGYLTRELARQIAEEFDCEINLMVTVRNGDPLYDPHSVVVNSSKGLNQHKVAKLIRKSLEERNWTKEILDKQPFLPTSDFDAL